MEAHFPAVALSEASASQWAGYKRPTCQGYFETALEFLDVVNVSATIDGKDFEEKISTQRCSPGESHAQPV